MDGTGWTLAYSLPSQTLKAKWPGEYALIDPNGSRPVAIHGAANWTEAGLSKPDGNDEGILFLRHAGIAQAFLERFRRMTEAPPEEPAGDEPEPDPAPEPEPESASEPDAA